MIWNFQVVFNSSKFLIPQIKEIEKETLNLRCVFLYTTTSVPTILLSFRKRTIKYINKGTTMLNVSILGSIECNKTWKNGTLMLFCIHPLIFWLLNVKFWHHIHFFSDIFSHYNAPMSTSIVWYCEKFSGHSDFSTLLEFFFYFCYFWRKKKHLP